MTPPITALGSRYGIQGALGRSVKRAAAGGSWWDLNGTITSCVVAYQPKGSASYAASLENLANSGTYTTKVDGYDDPTWNATDGWIFNGVDQKIIMGISGGLSMIIRFSGATSSAYYYSIAGTRSSASSGTVSLNPNYNGSQVACNLRITFGITGVAHFESGVIAGTIEDGVGCKGYKNGTKIYENDVTTGGYVGGHIGGTDGYGDLKRVCNIQAFAAYSATLTPTQIGNLTTAMAAL